MTIFLVNLVNLLYSREIESGRIVRLLTQLCTVVDRAGIKDNLLSKYLNSIVKG